MNTPPVTLSLMVTNPDDLATMLAVLRQNDSHDDDKVKQARAERDEATSEAIGWRKAAEEAQNRFLATTRALEAAMDSNRDLEQHAESLASQVEDARRQIKSDNRLRAEQLAVLTKERDTYRTERDECSGLLAKANEKLDGGKNQRILLAEQDRAAARAERRRLLGNVADLHPDEDPRDHVTH